MKYLPNVLSGSRVVLSLGVALLGWHQLWLLAFGLLLAAGATDVLDGVLAKRYGGTANGELVDMLCDLAMTACAFAGLVLGGVVGWPWLLLVAAVAVPIQLINSFASHTVLFRRFGAWAMPMYFLALVWLVTGTYAWLALPAPALVAFAAVGVLATAGLVRLKRHRLAAWFSGRAA
jgi:cardiolipin synthase (CMP-forming)